MWTRDLPPEHLLRDCPEPSAADVRTNGDLVEFAGKAIAALRHCNLDKEALREWSAK